MFPNLIEAFNSDLASVVQFTQVCILVLGFSNFVWYESRTTALHRSAKQTCIVPTQDRVSMQVAFGRRPVFIVSTLICLVSNI
jgi:hypothetical protein